AGGRELLFVETAGVGQSEVAVAGIADTVVLVLMPGSGDSVQALKAGVLEIPDVIVLNKSDLAGAATTLAELRQALSLGAEEGAPIVRTQAGDGTGVDLLWQAIEQHRAGLEKGGALERRRRENIRRELLDLAVGRMRRELEQASAADSKLDELVDAVAERRLDPLSAVRELRSRLG
ncbi:MAG: methylmalonyl Co-A mutase-associated GTPase MeaB, partial [Gaiellaceae bacterium]